MSFYYFSLWNLYVIYFMTKEKNTKERVQNTYPQKVDNLPCFYKTFLKLFGRNWLLSVIGQIIRKDPHNVSWNGKVLGGIVDKYALTVVNGLEGKCSRTVTRERKTHDNREHWEKCHWLYNYQQWFSEACEKHASRWKMYKCAYKDYEKKRI